MSQNRTNRRVLIIDDEASIRDGCSQILSRRGYAVEAVGDALEGFSRARTDRYDLILLDLKMPGMKGLDMLEQLKSNHRIAARIIIVTGYGTIPLSVEAIKKGADDFLTKPFTSKELVRTVAKALEERDRTRPGREITDLIGTSDYMGELEETIRRIAQTDSTVLVTGESGTGKELVARTIHDMSTRSACPFVPVDCSSLVETLMESALFGHVRGAFSGATESRTGRFQMADGGTLFLDEISNISLKVQATLLRVIQEQEVPRVGSAQTERIDVRLIAATNRDIRKEVEAGRFREDLFYRISVVPIDIKPLRKHKTDIMPIARYYLDMFGKKYKSRVRDFSDEAVKSLIAYAWPGNVRELKNTMERLCVLCDNETVAPADILYYGQHGATKAPIVDIHSGTITLVDVERHHIEKALRYFDFQINKTARFLGIDRKTLRTKIKTYGIVKGER